MVLWPGSGFTDDLLRSQQHVGGITATNCGGDRVLHDFCHIRPSSKSITCGVASRKKKKTPQKNQHTHIFHFHFTNCPPNLEIEN